jgi:hypothetical protein
VVAFPHECSKCPRGDEARRWGCGWDPKTAGKGKVVHVWDDKLRTCPRYYLEAYPDVGRVLYELEDYRRGALGPVGQLRADLVDYYRMADSTQRKWVDDGKLA